MDAESAMNTKAREGKSFQDVVRSAAAQLVSYEQISGEIYVNTPLMYSAGGYVAVRVANHGGKYFVSDFGAGANEAELMGAEGVYRRVAKSVAETAGVGFDQFSFFVLEVTEGQLPGAIATIANCSQEAVNITTMRVSERTRRDDNEVLFERLRSIFDPKIVARDVSFVGASNTEWHVSSLVTKGRQHFAFEAVSSHRNSVVHASTKFNDLARLKRAPGRVAVVTSKRALGTYLGVLSHSADVIEKRVGDEVYQRITEAA